jgi:hypothetical protein
MTRTEAWQAYEEVTPATRPDLEPDPRGFVGHEAIAGISPEGPPCFGIVKRGGELVDGAYRRGGLLTDEHPRAEVFPGECRKRRKERDPAAELDPEDEAPPSTFARHAGVIVARLRVEDELAEAVGDDATRRRFDPLKHVRVMTEDEVGAAVDDRVREVHVLRGRMLEVDHSEVNRDHDEVDRRAKSGEVFADDLQPKRRGSRPVGVGAPAKRNRIAEEAHTLSPPFQDSRAARLGEIRARAEGLDTAFAEEPPCGLEPDRTEVHDVVVREREDVEAGGRQASGGGLGRLELRAFVGSDRRSARERNLQVAEYEVGGGELLRHGVERVERRSIRETLRDATDDADVADRVQAEGVRRRLALCAPFEAHPQW